MELRQVIGRQIAREREIRGWSQDDLGARLGVLTGKAWTRQQVSRAEKGRRAFDTAEVLIFAKVLSVGVFSLLLAPDLDSVALTPEVTLSLEELLDLLRRPVVGTASEPTAVALAPLLEALVDLEKTGLALAHQRQNMLKTIGGLLYSPTSSEDSPQ